MNIVEFFNPHSIEHIRAYRVLSETGTWPEGFIPEKIGMEFAHLRISEITLKMAETWSEITLKMAEAWIDHFLG